MIQQNYDSHARVYGKRGSVRDMLTIAYGAQAYVAKFLQSFKEFPPSQRPASFTIDQVMEKLQQSIGD